MEEEEEEEEEGVMRALRKLRSFARPSLGWRRWKRETEWAEFSRKSFAEKRFAAAPAIGRPVNEFSPPKGSLSIQAR